MIIKEKFDESECALANEQLALEAMLDEVEALKKELKPTVIAAPPSEAAMHEACMGWMTSAYTWRALVLSGGEPTPEEVRDANLVETQALAKTRTAVKCKLVALQLLKKCL